MPLVSSAGCRYYADPAVQARIFEYCGARDDHGPTCAFVSQLGPGGYATWASAPRVAADQLPVLFAAGWDVSRSLLDRDALIVFLEIEVSDPDLPAGALLDPAHAFRELEPAYRAFADEFRRLELPLLDVMTGRGYHFAGRVPLTSSIVSELADLAPANHGNRVERAYTALGMVLEYAAHNIYRRAAAGGIPLVFNGVEVGRGGDGRESVSIDLSAYGDPLQERQMRVAFGTYQSHRVRPDIFGPAAQEVPVLVAAPRRGRPLAWMLEHAHDPSGGQRLARSEHAHLPVVTAGVSNLLVEYRASLLGEFHALFYSEAPHPPERWAATYDQLERQDLPPCIREPLVHPNDALLKPTVLQHLTRFLMARGWSPRHIAGLVWSKYARNHGWGSRWTQLEPQRRAEFDVRVFAASLVTGIDEAIDFNCVSHQEKGACPGTGCPFDLRDDRSRLLERLKV